MNLEKEIFEISLVDIMPNRFQPREIFDDQGLKELSDSIKSHGVIQPIIVRKVGDKYEIIAGERRYRASQIAGKQTIPALVRDIDDKEAAKIALLENLQRRDLTPIEEAKTYQTILKLDNITQEELAKNLGKSQSAIANKLRLLNLDEEVQTALLNSQISERHARSLLTLPNMKQKEILGRIINERLTVRQVDEEIMKLTGKMPEQDPNDNTKNEYVENNNINEQPIFNSNPVNIEMPAKEELEIKYNQEPIIKQENTQVPQTAIQEQVVNYNSIEENINENKQKNIFERLRVDNEQNDNREVNSPAPYENIYDLRFAINNFRQAAQNTEKFGFKVDVEEIDNQNSYQIIINIDKNK